VILSSEKNEAVAHYELGTCGNKVLSSEYKQPCLMKKMKRKLDERKIAGARNPCYNESFENPL